MTGKVSNLCQRLTGFFSVPGNLGNMVFKVLISFLPGQNLVRKNKNNKNKNLRCD